MSWIGTAVLGVTLAFGGTVASPSQTKRAITPADCVTIRYLNTVTDGIAPPPIAISPDGSRVAYLVKTPNLKTNENDIELYVRKFPEDAVSNDRPLLISGDISHLHWLEDNRHITVLFKGEGKHVVEEVDVTTGAHEPLVSFTEDIVEYSSARAGDVIVFAVEDPRNQVGQQITPQQAASGYRVPFKQEGQTAFPHRRLFIVRHLQSGWTAPKPIAIQSPFNRKGVTSFTVNLQFDMSLSPNGKRLLISYQDLAQTLPERWKVSGFVQWMQKVSPVPGTKVLVLYDIDSGTTTAPFESPFSVSIPLWSLDSRSFVVFGLSPVGSEWEKHDAVSDPAIAEHGNIHAHLFWVHPDEKNTTIELVATHQQAQDSVEQPMAWGKEDSLLVDSLDGTVTRFLHKNDRWAQEESLKLPVDGFSVLASDGNNIVGDTQSATTPPSLFTYRFGDTKIKLFARLNPQFDGLTLATIKNIDWKTSTGLLVRGTLFLPPNYKQNSRYPLVIQTKLYGGNWFMCDQGPGRFPSFVPQPLASAGIAYLGFYFPDDHNGKPLEDYYPQGYPGGIAEAALQTDVYDTAVETLARRGLIDSGKVGIIGFSRSGWYTEFALMFGKTHYKAATAADNVNYSFSEYAMGTLIGMDSNNMRSMFGGPPYGPTLKNWLRYSISFNLDKIHTPLLMEEMGYANPFDRRFSPPVFLSMPFEIFTGLNQLNKPVDFYYYPYDKHQPEHPQARLANLQRNLDWYRFWLQDYERPNPEDPNQYARWHQLRELQEEGGGGQAGSLSPNAP